MKKIHQEGRKESTVSDATVIHKIRTKNQPVALAEWRSPMTFSRKFQHSDGEILIEKREEEEGNYRVQTTLEDFDHSGRNEMRC